MTQENDDAQWTNEINIEYRDVLYSSDAQTVSVSYFIDE